MQFDPYLILSFNTESWVSPMSDSQEIFKACATLASVTDVFGAAVVVPAGDEEEPAVIWSNRPPDYATRVDD